MLTRIPDIGLAYEDRVPEVWLDEFRAAVASDGLDLLVEKRPSMRAFAGAEGAVRLTALAQS